ncbi:HutD/Ves family protein [Pseudomonas matsuisoli]|uniref:HutD family protein n=1 Tax=Pseudomonas matsuisoli TaxID=1515666 RepID=A0A917PW94_9PSED|nr:HutD family protein [Pseudomonas matsuisoli]GGJ94680.1 hypothetical protein GCM10009304_20930 [Pseudomonas matsuisoli]
MSDWRVYDPLHYTAMPWKNGAGTTLEIAKEGAGEDGEYDWRLSLAQIDADGPFSTFPGYRRIITVLQGDGMVLNVDGADSDELGPYQPFGFEGAATVNCRLLGSAIEDFNLIYRPDRVQASLRWVDCEGAPTLLSAATELLLFNASTAAVAVTHSSNGRRCVLGPRATGRCTNRSGEPLEYGLEGRAGRVCIVELHQPISHYLVHSASE